MERLSDRHHLPLCDAFRNCIDPFAVSNGCDLVYDRPSILPPNQHQASDYHVAPHSAPPQKLRPIRSHGPSPEENQTRSAHSEYVGTLESSPAMRFQGNNRGLPVIGEVRRDYTRSSHTISDGHVGKNLAGTEPTFSGIETGRTGLPTGSEIRCSAPGLALDNDMWPSSSEDSSGQPVNRKRKRKSRMKFKLFLKSLVAKVMEKQEQMHAQLIELIEKNERERILRQEAWERQETERVRREEALRTQEMNRNSALISFIRNVMGQDFQVPLPSHPEESCARNEAGTLVQRDTNCDLYSKRWPDAEVQALIMLRTTSMEDRLRPQKTSVGQGKQSSVWDEISSQMRNMGYNRSAKKCKEKWENINKYYRKVIEGGKKHPESSKTCSYFQELDVLYKNGFMNNTVLSPSCTERENKDQGK